MPGLFQSMAPSTRPTGVCKAHRAVDAWANGTLPAMRMLCVGLYPPHKEMKCLALRGNSNPDPILCGTYSCWPFAKLVLLGHI